MDASSTPIDVYVFDRFRLDGRRRVLLLDDVEVALTPTAMDVLAYLVSHAGGVVSKDELLDAVWHGRFVEEANIKQTMFTLRRALGPAGDGMIVTAPGRGYRFTPVVRIVAPEVGPPVQDSGTPPAATGKAGRRRLPVMIILAIVGVFIAGGAGVVWWTRSTTRDPGAVLVLADVANGTGEPVFDHALDDVLHVDLAQSPFFSVLSDRQTREVLTQMTRPADTPITPAVAEEICTRANGSAVLQGAIAPMGRRYLLTMIVTDCSGARVLSADKAEDLTREGVVPALDRLIARSRRRLGESVASVAAYDVPLVPARTISLDALKAFSEGKWLADHGRLTDALPYLQHAIELDPQFALAYWVRGGARANLLDPASAIEDFRKAYELRNLINARNRYRVVAFYNEFATKNYDATLRNYRDLTKVYPRDAFSWANLANSEEFIGLHAAAIEDGLRALALKPGIEPPFVVVARGQMGVGDFAAARKTAQAALDAGLGGDATRNTLLRIAFALGDERGMEEQEAWARTNPSARLVPLSEAEIAISRGQLKSGAMMLNAISQRVAPSPSAQLYRTDLALALIDHGFGDRARPLLNDIKDVDDRAYLMALAELGDVRHTEALIADHLRRFPEDTLYRAVFAPEARADLAMRRGAPREAIAGLQSALPYQARNFEVPYRLGVAELAAGDARAAVAEFQTILAHRGWYPESWHYPLAQLGLARALKAEGDRAGSRAAYLKLLNDWKVADPDLPPLLAARAELKALGL